MIDFTTRKVTDSVSVVEVSGILDETNRKYFFDCIGDMIGSGVRNIIIDCHRLGHVNSGAMASLLAARKNAAKNGGRIYLTRLSSSIAEVLQITRLGRLLAVYPSTEAALGHVEPSCVV